MGLAIEMVNPLLESFGEPTKAYVTNSSRPLANFKGKGNPDLPSVCSNYWPPNVAQFVFQLGFPTGQDFLVPRDKGTDVL
jgi:hypothetical protein